MTHEWAQYELNFARDRGIPALAVLEEGVEQTGPHASRHYIQLKREDPSDKLIKLSHTLAEWKRNPNPHSRLR